MTDTSPIVILAPTMGELRATVRRLRLQASGPLYRGTHGDRPLLAAATGMGRDRSRQALEQLCRHHVPAALLVIGFAGGLDPHLRAGQVVRVLRVFEQSGRTWDLGADGPPRTVQCTTGLGFSPGDDGACGNDGGERVAVVGVDRVVTTATAKSALRRQFPEAAVVDMESASFAAFAAERGLPLTILRAVSDPADAALPAGLLMCIGGDGATNRGAALGLLLRRPHLLPTMVRLGMAAHACSVNLADAVAQWLATHTASGVE